MGEQACLAIDIGGTKLASGIVTSDGELVVRSTRPTPKTDDAEVLFAELCALVDDVVASTPVAPSICGVGCGGPMEPGGVTVSPLNIPAWRAFPLRARLAEATSLDVAIDNDAKALALGEWWCGAGVGSSSFLAMVVSTGVGGGVILDGRILDGDQGNAGHIGHVVVDPEGHLCRCGVWGCLEAEASGTAIEAITGRPAAEATAETKRRTGVMVGRAVASVVTLLDLTLCVVAGSVALGFGEEFFDAAQAELDRHVGLSYARGARIIPAGLGDEGPLVGAGAVGFGLGRTRGPKR
jgi:glucokinase